MELERPQENIIWTAISQTFLLVGLFVLLLVFSLRKTVVIADGTRLEEDTAQTEHIMADFDLQLTDSGDKGILYIPLQSGTDAANVTVENLYLYRQIRICIQGADEAFYRASALYGDTSDITDAYCIRRGQTVSLVLGTDRIRECRTTMEGDRMAVTFAAPDEQYAMIVVLDPLTEEDAASTLKIATQVAEQLERQDIRIYLTRTGETEMPREELEYFAKEVCADAYIQIGLAASDDPADYGISARYNGDYFLPGYGNIQLCDALIRNTALKSVNRGLGMEEAEEDSVLMDLTIPAARLDVGFSTNTTEALLVKQGDYQTKLALGIAKALEEAAGSLAR